MFPAIALIEVSSIARGMVVSDACVKKAEIRLLASRPIDPGRYITVFWGEVAEVEEAYKEGERIAGDVLVDKLFLPGAHPNVLDSLRNLAPQPVVNSLGIVETFTVASILLSADAACKAAEVGILELRYATGIGGKSYFVLTGELHDVEAGIEAASRILEKSQLQSTEIIPRPAPDLVGFIW